MSPTTHRLRAALLAAGLLTACASRSIDSEDETESETSAGSGSDHVLGDGEQSCDPIEQSCAGGMGCYVADADAPFQCEPIGAAVAEGLPCLDVNDCLPGLICLASLLQADCENEFACCVRFCDVEQPICPPGTACLPYFQDGPTPEYGHVGVCLLP
jgi:hypothetical protein